MYNHTQVYRKNNGARQYLMKEILEATPQQLLLKVYDLAIVSGKRNDLAKTNMAIQELMNALRFDGGEDVKNFSTGIYRLYQYCQEQMRKGNNDNAVKILSELRESWIEVFSKK